ncbi:RimJ/RimL family protein N-acetyltransferase [Sinobacterium caligoides]|uniref:RimJ/RimL family protein N-acetyltransferase n=2 Tax=Sinobacterium caligoides TaxID=933926 RepID=A0A3N2DPS5_9GAMM|nr:RimJ/RimL family protein N-acetyltransferase [Sinobacterium caligoides]
MRCREARLEDAVAVLQLFHKLDVESDYMLFEPGERTTTVCEQEAIIRSFTQDTTKRMFVAEDGQQICGLCILQGGSLNRNKHVASLVIGVEKAYWRSGVGSLLMDTILSIAEAAAITRLELTVHSTNARAVKLYQRFGFVIEGERRGSINLEGTRVDEYYMARLSPAVASA